MGAHRPFVTLCQITDVHLAATPATAEGSPDEGLARAMELVAAEAPDGIVRTGDIADDMRLGAWRVVAIDTTVPGENGGRVDVAAVAQTLGADVGTPTVLAMHHPPLTTSTSDAFRLEGATDLVAMLVERSDVRVVLSGHLHEAFGVILGSVAFLGGSSSYYAIEHGSDEPRFGVGHVGALRLRLHDDGTCDWRRLPATSEFGKGC